MKEATKVKKEPKDKMGELLLRHQDQAKYFKVGDIVEGEIIAITRTSVLLDLDGKGFGIVFGRELGEDFSKENYKIGDRTLASVLELEDGEGRLVLSFRRASREQFWRRIREHFEKKESFVVKPVEANKGGLLIEIGGVRGFLPVSQLSSKHYPRVENGDKDEILERLKNLISKELTVQILDLDERHNKLIFSEKAAFSEERKELLSKFKIGDKIKGKVTGLVDFGVFVDLGGIEGLIHISEISWDKVEDISKFLKIGEEVEVVVIGTEDDKISLSLKRLIADPFQKATDKYKIGDLVEGEISKLTPFGAFVKLNEKVEGLIHISEIGHKKVFHPEDIFKVGDKVSCEILTIDSKQRKISLALKSILKEKTKKKAKG